MDVTLLKVDTAGQRARGEPTVADLAASDLFAPGAGAWWCAVAASPPGADCPWEPVGAAAVFPLFAYLVPADGGLVAANAAAAAAAAAFSAVAATGKVPDAMVIAYSDVETAVSDGDDVYRVIFGLAARFP